MKNRSDHRGLPRGSGRGRFALSRPGGRYAIFWLIAVLAAFLSIQALGAAPTEAQQDPVVVEDITETTATLRITDQPNIFEWWYAADKGPDTACTTIRTGFTNPAAHLTGLTPGTTYTYTIYAHSDCGPINDIITFTTYRLTAFDIEETTATLGITSTATDWSYRQTAPGAGSCTTVYNADRAPLTDLTPGYDYTFSWWLGTNCDGTALSSVSFSLPALPSPGPVDVPVSSITANSDWNPRVGTLEVGGLRFVDNIDQGFTVEPAGAKATYDAVSARPAIAEVRLQGATRLRIIARSEGNTTITVTASGVIDGVLHTAKQTLRITVIPVFEPTATPTPEATAIPRPTATPTATPRPTATPPPPVPTNTPTPTPEPTATPEPTNTPTPAPTATPPPPPTATPEPGDGVLGAGAIVGGLVVLALLGAGAYLIMRRRGADEGTPE